MTKPIKVASAAAAATLALGIVATCQTARAQTIIEEWDSIKAPPPPTDEIKPVQESRSHPYGFTEVLNP